MIKRIHLLLPFLVALILLCGQMPELLSLTDDISNDFEEESFAHVPKSEKVKTVETISQRGITFEEESKGITPIETSMQSVPASSPDLLRLLSIQRK